MKILQKHSLKALVVEPLLTLRRQSLKFVYSILKFYFCKPDEFVHTFYSLSSDQYL